MESTYPDHSGRFAKLLLRLPALRDVCTKGYQYFLLVRAKLEGEIPMSTLLQEMFESARFQKHSLLLMPTPAGLQCTMIQCIYSHFFINMFFTQVNLKKILVSQGKSNSVYHVHSIFSQCVCTCYCQSINYCTLDKIKQNPVLHTHVCLPTRPGEVPEEERHRKNDKIKDNILKDHETKNQGSSNVDSFTLPPPLHHYSFAPGTSLATALIHNSLVLLCVPK